MFFVGGQSVYGLSSLFSSLSPSDRKDLEESNVDMTALGELHGISPQATKVKRGSGKRNPMEVSSFMK